MSHVSMTRRMCMLGKQLDTTRIRFANPTEHDRMSILCISYLNIRKVPLMIFAEQKSTHGHVNMHHRWQHLNTHTHILPGMLLAARIRCANKAAGANGFLGSQRECQCRHTTRGRGRFGTRDNSHFGTRFLIVNLERDKIIIIIIIIFIIINIIIIIHHPTSNIHHHPSSNIQHQSSMRHHQYHYYQHHYPSLIIHYYHHRRPSSSSSSSSPSSSSSFIIQHPSSISQHP